MLKGENISDEQLLIQGVIDLFFVENDGLVLVDYKTDRLTQYNLEQRLEYYRGQLYWYRRALEEIQQTRSGDVSLFL